MSRPAVLQLLLFLLIITAPFLLAAALSGPQAVFGGFLLNPQDGNTYLAKMFQGRQGAWTYRLPFTHDPGDGVFLFGFYLFLGHAACWSGLPLIWVFHIARLIAAALMAVAVWRFFKRYTPAGWTGWCFGIGLLGLGMGWLLFPAGIVTSDFWVAETYPFLSAYVNPHFPLSLALMLGLLTLPESGSPPRLRAALLHLAGGALLSLLSPFGALLTVCILGAALVVELIRSRAWQPPRESLQRLVWSDSRPSELFRRLAAAGLGALPLSAHYLWTVRTHPQLAQWNAQNLTLTPAGWDVALALSPVLILAVVGAAFAVRSRQEAATLPMAWVVVALLFIYAPVALQRRFMLGLYVPLAALAAWGLDWMAQRSPKAAGRTAVLAFGLALPAAALILAMGAAGAAQANPQIYLSRGEAAALAWIEANTPQDALVLASPEMGLLIPAHTGRRVIYGHPYETVNAVHAKAVVEAFYRGIAPDPAGLLSTYGVDYVLYGLRESRLGPLPAGLPVIEVFSAGDVLLLQVMEP